MDMASGAVRESPAVLLKNAYWSPGYPAILALMMAVVKPPLATEVRAIYVVQWLIFVFTTVCLGLLLGILAQWLQRGYWPESGNDDRLFKAFTGFSYAFFLLSNMNHIIWYLTPDMLLQGLIYLSAAHALRLFLPDASWKHSAALGLTLGLGYLTKAAMFPVAMMLMGILFLRPPKDGLGRRHAAIALVCFCLAGAPLVLSLSHEKHRFTFGDSGKLNYAWVVGGLGPFSGWTGQPAGSGIPAHAPRKLSEAPLILEFRTPVRGTLPLWYDPSYWWEGVRVPFGLQRQLTGMLRPFQLVHTPLALSLALAAALAPLCLLSFRVRKALREGGMQTWILIVWPAAACLMYALVLFSIRYVMGYLVLGGIGAAAILLRPFSGATRVKVLTGAILLLAVAGTVRLRPIVQTALDPNYRPVTLAEEKDSAPTSALIAAGLTRLGIRPGDQISVLGIPCDPYYARLAGVRIVAQIWEDTDRMAGLSAPEVRQVLAKLKETGVKALVSRPKPGFVNDEGWVAIPETTTYVRML
jgi:hypothetical protein